VVLIKECRESHQAETEFHKMQPYSVTNRKIISSSLLDTEVCVYPISVSHPHFFRQSAHYICAN